MILVCSYVTWPVLHFVNQEVPEHGEGDFLEGQGEGKGHGTHQKIHNGSGSNEALEMANEIPRSSHVKSTFSHRHM